MSTLGAVAKKGNSTYSHRTKWLGVDGRRGVGPHQHKNRGRSWPARPAIHRSGQNVTDPAGPLRAPKRALRARSLRLREPNTSQLVVPTPNSRSQSARGPCGTPKVTGLQSQADYLKEFKCKPRKTRRGPQMVPIDALACDASFYCVGVVIVGRKS